MATLNQYIHIHQSDLDTPPKVLWQDFDGSCLVSVRLGDITIQNAAKEVSGESFAEWLRALAAEVENATSDWDEARLRQAWEDESDERDDQASDPPEMWVMHNLTPEQEMLCNEGVPTDPRFLGDAEHRHAPTGDHLLADSHPDGGF